MLITLIDYAKEHDIPVYPTTICRKTWIKKWRKVVCWSLYLDYQCIDVKDDVEKYCKDNKIQVECDNCWIYCISNRKSYNDIMNIINKVLCDIYGED